MLWVAGRKEHYADEADDDDDDFSLSSSSSSCYNYYYCYTYNNQEYLSLWPTGVQSWKARFKMFHLTVYSKLNFKYILQILQTELLD